MPTLHITRGFPAAGKTTWAEAFCAETGAVNINRDDIRRTLRIGQHGTQRQEDAVTSVQSALFAAAVDNRSDIVLSDMNLRPKRLRPFLTGADRAGYTVEFHDFRAELDELLRRNAARDVERQVPESLIRDLWSRFPQNRWPSAERIIATVRAMTDGTFSPVDNPRDLPHCVLVDIDGTLAHHNELRSPYDWERVSQDTVDESVRDTVQDIHAAGVRLVIMSGRDEVCRPETTEWLARHGIPWDELHMRPTGDQRSDWMVKDALVRAHIQGRFHIRYCLDDRQQVVDHYRAIGLKVFQVQPGDF
ncbi:AAA family ATPase [Corynebacterium variabile]|uniref:phosphatase domain-containing protein n=1 Tax=Corynebacterium variabile TaxID=1727 RepID=UPI0026481475|nr:AAA family ATPase [Corynebacterium variabile]MDN6239785.1 AAA family ATPase [Corynebacterium variabile]MDN6476934.1 AAA family ATPase [Corynebacterium variabile]MDN6843752.1 AAA family ATPase [Corynebacterium variabile]